MKLMHPQKGISLIETLISLAIFSLISVAASQALQRASLLNDKITEKSRLLQERFSLEQLISRDLLNSKNIVWPSQDCRSPENCFVLELKHTLSESKENRVRYLRYRANEHGLFRDQLDSLGNWGEFQLSEDRELASFSFFRAGSWHSDSPGTAVNSLSENTIQAEGTAQTTDTIQTENTIKAIAIDWQYPEQAAYQQTLLRQ
ncbi:prepilin-type N-terminal cleavage/methylation domain-containing protein [uncultured Pseudoteredinibacter sp.]|uniref:PulJ/GspJ family protein n=1 Tax=uncultured Pseudoteredinibacter sp. TaxID=1641701 RepID=UPI0026179044|nr:prepilin-type N-terminal cleavage/methylation domain-containing protein [uncultured Pseudoteredinibacter sp.]